MKKTRRYSKKALYENIMYRVQKELKRSLNENENDESVNIKVPSGASLYSAAYIDSSSDGYALYSTFFLFSTYEKAFNYLTEQQLESETYTYIIDYETDTYWIWDDILKEYVDSNEELPDTSNDGSALWGAWVIQKETVDIV